MESTNLPGEKSEPEDKSQLVQMRLQRKTLNRLENLAAMTKTNNRTQLISTSIELTEEIVKNLQTGAKVYIETPGGVRESLKIIGI